ncbi:MAG: prolipoprotein diacylglyceryl transferase [Alphaproteobacteria bacterium]|nr:prolipoprotein diacylglyceryl transferase [Alphaproteobacteria bacterium]MCZ6496420.1 prolipoprotein diacylglyceryl transferase [Alphaproteobacteria bacterium]MCZ6609326.1 prolipoprotein diacylglyceryl transferase [Alphaproteobacteria bacterium]MCZ6742166.1 prolipoprotein diacylglyceryl transferase [Alphaproteobacteria bacterium]MCZ6813001.1 prolipoprotein diacylglyceryl transferase [Alphaproteobacteria bacterium]
MPPFLALPFPAIDPVIVSFGPFAIRWYALSYVAGLLIGWWIMMRLADHPPAPGRDPVVSRAMVDDFLLWATLGVILGGRLGYVLFYNAGYYLADPLRILEVWKGGMSFHGGLLGVVIATVLFARRRHIPILAMGDLVCLVAPIGLFFGRIANFINGELYGRPSDVPWAMVFPTDPLKIPRHPSQLYEAAGEGIVLLLILSMLARFAHGRRRQGLITGAFFLGYAFFRSTAELFRQPDAHIGFLTGATTMGQWLSVPVAAAGVGLIWVALTRVANRS